MLQTWHDVLRWCLAESAILGMAFVASIAVVIVATGAFRILAYILSLFLGIIRFVWRICVMFRTLYMGMFYPKVLLNEIERSIAEPYPKLQQTLDKVLSENRSKSKEVVIDLTMSDEDSAKDLHAQVKNEVRRYHMSQAFRDVIVSHVNAVHDKKSAEERNFENQEKTREETAWHRLYVEMRVSFHKVSKKLTEDELEIETGRIAGFEIAFGKENGSDGVVREDYWTIEQKIHFAKRFVIDLFDSDELPLQIDPMCNSDADEEYSTVITHINPVVLCGRIYVETIDNWNKRTRYDPSDYSSMLIYLNNNNMSGNMSDAAWLKIQEKDRTERRARLSEEAQYAQNLAEAIEADRIIARDSAILMNVRTHRSGKTYAT